MLAVAMVLNLFGPTVLGMWLKASGADVTQAICSSTGLRTLSVAALHAADPAQGDPSGPAEAAAHLASQHCALCMLGQAWVPPLGVALSVAPRATPSQHGLRVEHTLARQRLAWAQLPARAPPTSV
jgi:hypothetical protein